MGKHRNCSLRGQRFNVRGRIIEIETATVDAVINGGHDDGLLDCGFDTWLGRDADGCVCIVSDRELTDQVA